MAVSTSDLQRIPLLAQVPPERYETLCQQGWYATYDAGQLIAVEGEAEPPVFFVVQGRVCGFKSTGDGRRQTVAQLPPGAAFFLPAVFAQDSAAPTSAQAVTSAKLICYKQSDFRRLTTEIPELGQNVLRLLSEKLKHLLGLAHDLGLLSVRGRLASFLLQNFRSPAEPGVRWTHDDIAAAIGTVREVVSRTLRAFAREGLIQQEGPRILLMNQPQLEVEAAAGTPAPGLRLTETQSA